MVAVCVCWHLVVCILAFGGVCVGIWWCACRHLVVVGGGVRVLVCVLAFGGGGIWWWW